MKKLLSLISLIVLVSCAQDPIVTEVSLDIPQALKITETLGIKTESIIVEEEVRMNVKLPYSGQYRIKLKDIEGKLISQEIILANIGDNLLKVYVSTLPKSSYRIELADIDHKILGVETIVVN
jgi:hypothetical protein